MANYTFVCFECRKSARRGYFAQDVRCPSCSREMTFFGSKGRVPSTRKLQEWKDLQRQFLAIKGEAKSKALKRKKLLEQFVVSEIERIGWLPENAGRRTAKSNLRKMLQRIQSQQEI